MCQRQTQATTTATEENEEILHTCPRHAVITLLHKSELIPSIPEYQHLKCG